jgi:uncharacterized membrane protein
MAWLLTALAVFLAFHALPAIRPLRTILVTALGQRIYLGLFSAVSTGLLVWLIAAYLDAPYVELWPYDPALRWLALAVMPVSCWLIAAGLTSKNPFSLGAGSAGFDTERPGIVRLTRHPAIWGLALWSAVHIPVNGDAASVLMFGLLTLLCLAGVKTLDARRRRSLGDENWRDLLHRVRSRPASAAVLETGLARLLLAAAVYAGLLTAHEPVIGVSPLPVP